MLASAQDTEYARTSGRRPEDGDRMKIDLSSCNLLAVQGLKGLVVRIGSERTTP